MSQNLWSQREKDFLCEHYPARGAAWCAERLSGRNKEAVLHKASRMALGISDPSYIYEVRGRKASEINTKYDIPKEWLRQKYLVERLSDRQIAEIVGCCFQTVHLRRKKYGIAALTDREAPNKGRPCPDQVKCAVGEANTKYDIDEKWLRQKYTGEGLSDQAIAEMIGCSSGAITYNRRKYGIPANPHPNKGRRRTPEFSRKLSEAFTGRVFSKEHRRKLGEAKTEFGMDEEWLCRKYIEEELTDAQIAELIGCSHGTVWKRRKKYGILSREHLTSEVKERLSKSVRKAWANGDFDDSDFYPHPVEYNGITMRSTWEERLAAVFDALQWQWEYEPRRFLYELDDGPHTYTPDFYVRETNTFYDPHWALDDASDKFNAVRAQHDIALIVLDEPLLEMYERAARVG